MPKYPGLCNTRFARVAQPWAGFRSALRAFGPVGGLFTDFWDGALSWSFRISPQTKVPWIWDGMMDLACCFGASQLIWFDTLSRMEAHCQAL